MKKLFITALLTVFIGTTIFATPIGIIFTSVKEPVTATSLPTASKKIQGANISILNLVGFGNSSIESLAKQGGISQIKNIDKETFSIFFGLFTSETFTIYGE